jgi:hypothetical protein
MGQEQFVKKISVSRAYDILMLLSNGAQPDCSIEELMLATRMGAVGVLGLGKVGTMAVEMANAALEHCAELKKLEGDEPVNRIHVGGVNGETP